MTPVIGPGARPSSSYDHLIKLLLIGDSGTIRPFEYFNSDLMCFYRCRKELSAVEVLR